MAIDKIKIQNFTVFKDIEIEFRKGINVFIGENGTGKTHLLKALYGSQIVTKDKKCVEFFNCFDSREPKLIREPGRMIISTVNSNSNNETVKYMYGEGEPLIVSTNTTVNLSLDTYQFDFPIVQNKSVFINAKDILTNARGLVEMAEKYKGDFPFDATFLNIIKLAKQWRLHSIPSIGKNIVPKLEALIDGKVVVNNETFYIEKNNGTTINFSVEAEGLKKLGLLWLLLMTENIESGTILLWDEPEANLNPKLIPDLVEILLELSRNGVQIFLATHDYILAKYFDVRRKKNDILMFHALYKTEQGVKSSNSNTFKALTPNPIVASFDGLMSEIYQNIRG